MTPSVLPDNYTYDKANQLLSDGVNTYTWDANGNPKGSSYTIGAGNRLESDGTWNFVYDDEGNLTSKIRIATGETWEYNYNHENRLVGVTKRDTSSGPAVLKVWFKYDVQGNRIEKTVDPDGDGPQPATTEKFTYTEDGNAWADLDASGNITTRRMYLDAVDALFARIGSGDPEWYLTDHLGSVRQIADSSGAILDEITYDGFGAILSESSLTTGDRYKYTAREWDTEMELQYNRARYYDPSARRWISQDPIGFDAGDGNLYRYVMNQAVRRTDPSGLILLIPRGDAKYVNYVRLLFRRTGLKHREQATPDGKEIWIDVSHNSRAAIDRAIAAVSTHREKLSSRRRQATSRTRVKKTLLAGITGAWWEHRRDGSSYGFLGIGNRVIQRDISGGSLVNDLMKRMRTRSSKVVLVLLGSG